jgi:hypothetical protein
MPDSYDPREREWAIGLDQSCGRIVLVMGSGADIDWPKLPHCQPISHSHPLDTEFMTGNKPLPFGLKKDVWDRGVKLEDLIQEMFSQGVPDPSPSWANTMVALLPSDQDMRANYLTDAGKEVLYTPYRWNSGTKKMTVARGDAPIVIEFGPVKAALVKGAKRGPGVNDSDLYRKFVGRMIIKGGQDTIWDGWISCSWREVQNWLTTQNPEPDAKTKDENNV